MACGMLRSTVMEGVCNFVFFLFKEGKWTVLVMSVNTLLDDLLLFFLGQSLISL